MTRERADLGFSDALDAFDPAEWAPRRPRRTEERPAEAETRKAAAAAGFRSREPQAAEPATGSATGPAGEAAPAGQGALPRRRRTGRSAQLNLKVRPETIAAFCAMADRQGWGLGETLEQALAALEAREASVKTLEARGASGQTLEARGASGQTQEARGASGQTQEARGASGQTLEACEASGQTQEARGASGQTLEACEASGQK